MTPAALTDALRRLEAAGWPIHLDLFPNGSHASFTFSDEDIPRGFAVPLEEPLVRSTALLMYWLVDCLESRGYRREVVWTAPSNCTVTIGRVVEALPGFSDRMQLLSLCDPSDITRCAVAHGSEFDALLTACVVFAGLEYGSS